MKLLLDTHLLLWAAGSEFAAHPSARLSPTAVDLIDDLANELFFSAASFWEIAIKNGLGRSDFNVNIHLLRQGLLENGYTDLPITSYHSVAVESLP